VASFNVNRFVRLKHPIFAAVLSVLDRVLKDVPWPCRSNCPRHWDAAIANYPGQRLTLRIGIGARDRAWSIQAPFSCGSSFTRSGCPTVVCISLRLHPRWRSSVIGVLAIINCSCAFHFIEQCALPKLLAVLVGKWEAIRFISDV
jgi:hypothetical protein